MNISKKNLIIIVIVGILSLASAICGIVKNSNSSKIFIESAQPVEKTGADLAGKTKDSKETDSREIFIHIIGAVKNPGIVKISSGARISDALRAAGGSKENADLEMINLAYKLEDGQQVYIPAKEESLKLKNNEKKKEKRTDSSSANSIGKLVPGAQTKSSSNLKTISDAAGGVKAYETDESNEINDGVININTADLVKLDSLPGIGPSTAQKIIDYRNTGGKFKVIEDIMKVKGIGKSKYEQIKNKIKV